MLTLLRGSVVVLLLSCCALRGAASAVPGGDDVRDEDMMKLLSYQLAMLQDKVTFTGNEKLPTTFEEVQEMAAQWHKENDVDPAAVRCSAPTRAAILLLCFASAPWHAALLAHPPRRTRARCRSISFWRSPLTP